MAESDINRLESKVADLKRKLSASRRSQNLRTEKARYINRQIIAFIKDRDKGICVYCGESGNEIDHVIPWSRGGPTSEKNLVLACYTCNTEKSNSESRSLIQKGLAHLVSRNYSWAKEQLDELNRV